MSLVRSLFIDFFIYSFTALLLYVFRPFSRSFFISVVICLCNCFDMFLFHGFFISSVCIISLCIYFVMCVFPPLVRYVFIDWVSSLVIYFVRSSAISFYLWLFVYVVFGFVRSLCISLVRELFISVVIYVLRSSFI